MKTDLEQSREMPKAEAVRNLLRAHIVSGRYCPGNRLPTFVELEDEFSVGRAVLQQALAELKRDGFVRSVSRQGMYVVPSPPHLHRYGIVMASSPGEPGCTQLMTALSNEAHRVENNDPHANFQFIYGVQDKEIYGKAVAKLSDDIRSYRLAGLFLTPKTFDILEHPSLAGLNVPHVFLWAAEEMSPRIGVDGVQLIQRALHFLKEKGRQRIAIIHMADTTHTLNHDAMYAAAGLDFHRPWIQRIGRSHPQFAEDVTSLLMDYRFDARPDGLIIADDNLVQPVSRALIANGIKVGQDLEIVAHCNWPWPAESLLPMTRIGFDIREIVQRAMEVIGLQREGKTPPASYQIQARFEHEMPSIPVSDFNG